MNGIIDLRSNSRNRPYFEFQKLGVFVDCSFCQAFLPAVVSFFGIVRNLDPRRWTHWKNHWSWENWWSSNYCVFQTMAIFVSRWKSRWGGGIQLPWLGTKLVSRQEFRMNWLTLFTREGSFRWIFLFISSQSARTTSSCIFIAGQRLLARSHGFRSLVQSPSCR